MSTPEDGPGTGRSTLVTVAVCAVIALAVVALTLGLGRLRGNSPVADIATTPTATVPSVLTSATPTPTVPRVAYANCGAVTFGPALAPLGEPASVHSYAAAPPMTIDTSKLYLMIVTTSRGAFTVCLQPNLAPNTVNVIVTLARNHYYDGIPIHRVVPGFVAQVGDPDCIGNAPPSPAAVTGNCGSGGPGFTFNDEPVRQDYVLGAVAMANSGPDTNGSQIFVCTVDDSSNLQPAYNLFGKVASGMSVVLALQQGDVMTSVTVAEQQ